MTGRAERIFAYALGLLAVGGTVSALIDFHQMGVAALWVVVPNFLAGVPLTLRWNVLAEMGRKSSAAVTRRNTVVYRGLFTDAGIVLGIQVVIGLLLVLVVMVIGVVPFDPTNWLAVLLMTLIGAIALGLSLLIGMLIVRPIMMLCAFIWARAHGKHADPLGPAIALLLVLIVPFAITATLSGSPAPEGSSTKGTLRGILLIIELIFYTGGDVRQQLWAWAARALLLAMAGVVIWIVRIGRRRSQAS